MPKLSFTEAWSVIGSVASVIAMIVGIATLEWPTIKAWIRRRVRPGTNPSVPTPVLSRSSIVAATSATVGVISLSIAAVLAKYPAPIEKAAPVTVVASPVEKPQISATQKPSELSIGKDRLPDEPSKLQPKPKVESSKKEDLAEARKATEEKITKTQAAVVPNYTWDIPWESYPNRSWLQREKSDAAKSAGIAGTATVSCILAPNGRIWTECKITDEIPAGYGFGATMIKFVQASTLKADYGFVTRVGSKPFPLTMTFPIE